MLDVRPAAAFGRLHLAGSVSIPVDAVLLASADAEGLNRVLPSILLPPRHESLLIVGSGEEEVRPLLAHLAGRGRRDLAGWVLDAAAVERLPADRFSRGDSGRHLWRPDPWLEKHADLLPPAAAGPVLDLGCGSGRSAVWLALRGYRVTGLDRQPEALDLGGQLANTMGTKCRFRPADLRRPEAVPTGPWAVILNFRFLQREMLARIPTLLQPGGAALVRTFRDALGYEGHPHRRHRLGRGELLKNFPAGWCEVLAHEEGHDPDGRPAAGIVARRRVR